MQSASTYAVIMAGGVGTRLWPQSRQQYPKQFLDILGLGYSLLQSTYAHMRRHVKKANLLVVTHEEHAHLVRSQLPELSPSQILCEPTRRNTAPCIAYASYRIRVRDPSAVTIVTPADHYITDNTAFDEAISLAVSAASVDNCLLTLGIQPLCPNTGYGYIQFLKGEDPIKVVKTFTEKPELSLAEKFVESGEFLWNTGIFVWHVSTIVEALEKYTPGIAEIFSEGIPHYHTSQEESFLKKAYSIAPTLSIDYGIMEKHEKVYVVPCKFNWSDLGSWEALYEILLKDQNRNVCIGSNALTYNSKGNILRVKKEKVLLIEGLNDYLVADFDDALVICRRDSETKFRQFIQDVKTKRGKKYV